MLKGKNAIITGCRRGIGREILNIFAENGADIWACVRAEDADFTSHIKGLEQQYQVNITPVYFDLADPDSVKAATRQISKDKRPVDILVNNAGVIDVSLFVMSSIAKMKDLFEVNFFAQMAFTQSIARLMMRQKQGSIINFSSSAAIEGNEGRSGYAASKAAIMSASKVMARELGAMNIRVNVIAPGLTQTDMMTESTPDDALATTLERLSLKRVADPREIASVALFLASDLSSYMTGQTLSVDGGM